ncbi:MAG: bifunctional 2-methylcitrate dehydratase/aconitate hydratase [Thermaerobacter sp.]|nr:bifunctional 2-methylcitrate dehydratase/aconitate hydratase [Thermaerobacter sp.]
MEEHTEIIDEVLTDIAAYVTERTISSPEAYRMAQWVLADTLGAGILALNDRQCRKLLGPLIPGTAVAGGCRVPGLAFELDPVQAAFNIGCMNRWLDYNDTWLAREWGHPSDNIGAILAVADWKSRQNIRDGKPPLPMREVLTAIIKAHEIQGVLSLGNSLNRVGLDHVLFVKVASTAVATHLLGGTYDQVVNALSQAWLDNGSLRTYRHGADTGSRKSWAAGDATSRAVRLALLALTHEMGYPRALSAPDWGFNAVVMRDQAIHLAQPLDSYVIEHVLFKLFPAEFHGQTAVEAALELHPAVTARWDDIDRVVVRTQESAMRIINKRGPLKNPADRDHCIQYMTAVALIHGDLSAEHYDEATAADGRIEALREKMTVEEDPQFSRDYLDPAKRSVGNTLQVYFRDGSKTPQVTVEYPLGHHRRRQEAERHIWHKCETNLSSWFVPAKVDELLSLLRRDTLDSVPVPEFLDAWRP